MKIFKKISFAAILSITALSISSCQALLDYIFGNIDLGFGPKYNPDDYATVTQEAGDYSKFTYLDLNAASYDGVTPSRGTMNIIVVPVQWRDLPSFSQSQLEAIDASFNGNKEDNTNEYWESCKSFYYKSSNGILNFNFNITDIYTPSYSSTRFINEADDYGNETSNLLDDIYENGLSINSSSLNFRDSKWDSNSDGYVDGIWLVYNQRDSSKVDTTHFWAYVANYYGNNTNSRFGKYGNCALSFLYDDSSKGYDAHTIIHETGHMLGLDDYYDYNHGSNHYSYDGALNMMDLNIGDHDAFSKFSLGWTKSLVVNESKTITLKPFEESYDSIIIPSNSYNGSAFGEYLMIEYYTPTGLFKLDAMNNYRNNYPKFFTSSGLRVWHIDSRLTYATYYDSGVTQYGSYLPNNIESIPNSTSTSTKITYVTVAHTNSPDDNYRNKDGIPLIELVSKTNSKLYNTRYAANKDLFVAGDTINSSSISRYLKSGKFNDGTPFNVSISVNSITDEGAELTFTF